MGRPLRNTVVLAKIEGTYGSDPTPTGADNALLVSNFTQPRLISQNVDRNVLRASIGGFTQLVANYHYEVSFDIEIAGSGTATTPPAWGPLVRACGFTETVQSASVDYTPISTISGVTNTSVTLYCYFDGQLHEMNGCRGTFSIEKGIGERPVFRFRFLGKYVAPIAASNASPTLTAWQTPLVVNDANTGDVTLGSLTYTSSTGVLSGGTGFPSRGLRLDVGNNVVFQPLLGAETVEITARDVTGSVSFDLTASQAVTAFADVLSNSTTGLGLTHGTTAGNIIVLHAPAVQRISPQIEDFNGNGFHAFQLRCIPVSGNDELRIVSR